MRTANADPNSTNLLCIFEPCWCDVRWNLLWRLVEISLYNYKNALCVVRKEEMWITSKLNLDISKWSCSRDEKLWHMYLAGVNIKHQKKRLSIFLSQLRITGFWSTTRTRQKILWIQCRVTHASWVLLHATDIIQIFFSLFLSNQHLLWIGFPYSQHAKTFL